MVILAMAVSALLGGRGGGEAVVGMEGGAAHVAGKPPDTRHVGPRLAGIAEEDGLLVRARGVAHPLDLRGRGEVHGGAVELSDGMAGERGEENGENGREGESLDAAHAVSY